MYPNGGFAGRPGERQHAVFPVRSNLSLYICLNLSPQENPLNDVFAYAPPGFEPGPNQTAFPDALDHPGLPILDQPAGENLRRLASRYVHQASRVDVVRVEPGFTAGRYRAVIVLDMVDFL